MTMGCLSGWFTKSDWKYGLHADRTILCAFSNRPSTASVTSTKLSSWRSWSNTESMFDWWLFHRRQNRWEDMFGGTGVTTPGKLWRWRVFCRWWYCVEWCVLYLESRLLFICGCEPDCGQQRCNENVDVSLYKQDAKSKILLRQHDQQLQRHYSCTRLNVMVTSRKNFNGYFYFKSRICSTFLQDMQTLLTHTCVQ